MGENSKGWGAYHRSGSLILANGFRLIILYGILSLYLFSSSAKAQDLMPIEKILEKAQSKGPIDKDPALVQYVFIRCSALYLVFGANYTMSDNTEAKVLGEKLLKQSEHFMKQVYNIQIKMGGDVDKELKIITEDISKIQKVYIEKIKEGRLMTGNAHENPLIKSDYNFCIELQNNK